MSRALLEVEDLTTRFDTEQGTVTAVDGISYVIEGGDTVGIVGESGSGKSVSVRSLVRIIDSPGRIESGRVYWKGRNVLEMSQSELRQIRGEEISMIFQDPGNALDPTYTVGYQIVEAIRAHRDVDEEAAWDEAVGLLDEVGIPSPEESVHQYPHEYSGGMKQRAMIAIALANQPSLLIADEPTTGLDVTIQAKIIELFERLQETYDMTILLITHDIGVVSEVCDDIMVMYAGRIVERGSRDEILHDARHPYTQALLRSVPRIDEPSELSPIEGSPPNLVDPPSGCRFHPRCPEAKPMCSGEIPPDVPFERGHSAECYIYTEEWEEAPRAAEGEE